MMRGKCHIKKYKDDIYALCGTDDETGYDESINEFDFDKPLPDYYCKRCEKIAKAKRGIT